MDWLSRLLLVSILISGTACSDAPGPVPRLDTERVSEVQRPNHGPEFDRPQPSIGPQVTQVEDGTPNKLVLREAKFQYDNVKYAVVAPGATRLRLNQDAIEIDGDPHFNMQIEFGQHDLQTLAAENRTAGKEKIILELPDTLVIQKQVSDPSDPETLVETHAFFMNRTFGYRDFKISSSDMDSKLGRCYFSLQDCQTMLQAAKQFALIEPLPTDLVQLLEKFDITFSSSLNGTRKRIVASEIDYLWLPYYGTTDSTLPLLANFPNLTTLKACSLVVKDSSWAVLTKLPKLERLDIENVNLGDEGVAILCRLSQLKEIQIQSKRFPLSAIRRLAELPALEILAIDSDAITDATLDQFPNLPNLKDLTIRGADNQFHGSGLRHLAQHLKLSSLNVSHGQITDDGLQGIGQLKTLKKLYLSDCGDFTGAGIRHLRSLTELELLNLDETKITDEAVEPLCALKSLSTLKELDLSYTHLSAAGLAKVKAALPNCDIHGISTRNAP